LRVVLSESNRIRWRVEAAVVFECDGAG